MEHSIRPRERLAKYSQLREIDLRRFHDLFCDEKNQDRRCCPACGQDNCSIDFTKDGFTFCRCQPCACLYVNPVPTEALLGEYYDGAQSIEYFHREILVPTLAVRRKIFRERVERMEPFVSADDRILEVGSSIGLFVEAALGKGWEPTAVEINTELVKHLRNTYKVPVYHGFFEQLRIDDNYDVVVMWEVIEHLREPGTALHKARGVLGDSGKLILTLPNIDGLEFRLLNKEHELVEAPGHINYFSVQTLRVLLERHGFVIEHYETPGILDFVNIMNAVQSGGEQSIGGRLLIALSEVATHEEWQSLNDLITSVLQREKLSGNMFVVARKQAAEAASANRACA